MHPKKLITCIITAFQINDGGGGAQSMLPSLRNFSTNKDLNKKNFLLKEGEEFLLTIGDDFVSLIQNFEI